MSGVALPGTLVRPSFDCDSVEAMSDENPEGDIHSATSGGSSQGGVTVTAEPGDPERRRQREPLLLTAAATTGRQGENDTGQTEPEAAQAKSTTLECGVGPRKGSQEGGRD